METYTSLMPNIFQMQSQLGRLELVLTKWRSRERGLVRMGNGRHVTLEELGGNDWHGSEDNEGVYIYVEAVWCLIARKVATQGVGEARVMRPGCTVTSRLKGHERRLRLL